MYGALTVTEFDNFGKELKDEDPIRLEEFQAKIDRGEKIEPQDWMPFM